MPTRDTVSSPQHVLALDVFVDCGVGGAFIILIDFPWSLQHIVPFWSGAEHHDFHHMAFVNNFSTSFRWWDRILGTDKKYQAYRERMRAATKGLDAAHRKAVEEKMVAEEEEAGFAAEKEVERLAEDKKTQ